MGIEGDRELATVYLKKYYRDVRYIDSYAELFLYDIDRLVGIGERKFDGGIIRTCVLVHCLMTRRQNGNIYEQLETVHKHIKEREANESKEEVQSS